MTPIFLYHQAPPNTVILFSSMLYVRKQKHTRHPGLGKGKSPNFSVVLKLYIIGKEIFRILNHSANPKSRPVGIIVFTHVVRPSSLFKHRKTKQQKTRFATGGLWVWPSGSLMTPVLWILCFKKKRYWRYVICNRKTDKFKWTLFQFKQFYYILQVKINLSTKSFIRGF